MNTLVITVADETLQNLEQRAESSGKSSAEIAADLVEDVFGSPVNGKTINSTIMKDASVSYAVTDSPPAERLPAHPPKTARQILEEAGMVVPLSEELRKLIIPGVTLDEVQDILAESAGPSLTEILDEHRGPKG